MASAFILSLYLPLRDDLTALEQHTLNYMFNGRADAPAEWPQHEFFRMTLPPSREGGDGGFPGGAYAAASWSKKDHPGMFSGLHFTHPNLKETAFGNYYLHMMKWLATLSTARGYIGSFTNQDDNVNLPLLFFVFEGELYLTSVEPGAELHSADSQNTYAWPAHVGHF